MTRILIVDDNSQVRNALRICLQMNQGHVVCGEAENGHDGVELAKRLKPDIVLLDYAMPTMNGLEAARLISAWMPRCGIILFTMFASTQLSTLAQAAGVRTVISKDVGGVDAIIRAIEEISRKGNLSNQTPIGARAT
jgi:DNA-binding NarL/FixJ family response regulator